MVTELEVWAPRALSVELVSAGGRSPMRATRGGWFVTDLALPPGTRYAFSLDGGPPRPDPRSPSQPEGVHGPSETVDHGAFAWTDHDWVVPAWPGAVVYELHVGTFSPQGTFDGVLERLPHLLDLGVSAVELMPVAEFPGTRGWGYDGVDLFAPHHHYGGPEGLKRLVDGCHAAGVAVILDVVYNHLGPDGNYLGEFGPYFTGVYQTPWGQAMNFDGPGSDEVRRYFGDNAVGWLRDYHVDGLRLDAVHAIIDTSAVHFLEYVRDRVRAIDGTARGGHWLIAESDLNDPRVVRPAARGGFGFDAQWSDDFHHALHAALTGERSGYYRDFGPIADIATAFRQAYVYAGRYSEFRGRTHGRPAEGVAGTAFLGYSQDHDQVGNRARGERLATLVGGRLARVAAALVVFAPFVPMLFAGEEWAATTPFLYFTDHQSEELGRAVTEGRRREFEAFGWTAAEVPDPQAESTFSASVLAWDELTRPSHSEMLAWYRELLALRRDHPALVDGRLEDVVVDYDEASRWLEVSRGALALACNLGAEPIERPCDGELLLASDGAARLAASRLLLPPESAAITRRS